MRYRTWNDVEWSSRNREQEHTLRWSIRFVFKVFVLFFVIALLTVLTEQALAATPCTGTLLVGTTSQSTTTSGSNDYAYGTVFTAGATGTGDTIWAYFGSEIGGGVDKLAVWDSSENLLASCELSSFTANDWSSCTISQAITNGNDYRLGIMFDAGDNYGKTTGGDGIYYDAGDTYPTVPDPFSGSWATSGSISMCIEASGAGGGNPIHESLYLEIVQ